MLSFEKKITNIEEAVTVELVSQSEKVKIQW